MLPLVLSLATAARGELSQAHVDYSVAAGDLLARCRQAAATDPARAMALLEQLLTRHGEQLAEVQPGWYLAAALAARQQVSQWPATAVEYLQQTWDPPAARQWRDLAASPEIVEIDRFARRYFFTAAGAQAAERVARLAMEAGQVDLAQREIADLLAHHPQRRDHAARWRTLLAASLQLSGQEPAGPQALPTAPSQPQETPAGQEAIPSLPAIDPTMLSRIRPLPTASAPVDRLEGNASLTMLWQVNLTDKPGYALNRQKMTPHWLPVPVWTDAAHRAPTGRNRGGETTPAAGLVITQWDRHCFAFDPDSGMMVWDYYPLSHRMAVQAGIAGATAPRRPVVSGDRVYAVSEALLPRRPGAPAVAVQVLACLDRVTGRPCWLRGAADRNSREAPTMLDGTPVVAGDQLYVIARLARTSVYSEVFLMRIDAHTGDLLNRVHLFGMGRVEQVPLDRIKPVRLGVRGGIVYIASAAGAVGAFDANSLAPIWMRSFKPQAVVDAVNAEVPQAREPNVPPLWADEPLVVGDRLIVPVDASIQILDRRSGQGLASVVLEGPVSALTGLPGRPALAVALVRRNLCIIDLLRGSLVRKVGIGKDGGTLGAMTALADGRVLVSAEGVLWLVQPDGPAISLAAGQPPAGIPSLARGRLYLGTNGYLACVSDGERPLADLQREMKTSNDPSAALRAAEAALRMDRPEVALPALRSAMRQGGADVARVGSPAVRQLFEVCLTFARQYTARPDAKARQVAEELFELAGKCPAAPQDRVRMYAAQSDLRLAERKPAEAVAAWQAVVTDEALRTAPLSEPVGRADPAQEAEPAGARARAFIAEMIDRYGQTVYERFDAEAAALLAAGGSKNLNDLLTRYPNSRHVPQAHLRIAELALAGDPKAALSPLRQAATMAGAEATIRAQAMLHLARVYEGLGHLEAAAAWMSRLAGESPDWKIEADGRAWTARQYAADLANRLPRPVRVTRHVDLPLQALPPVTLGEGVSLLEVPPPMDWSGNGAALDRTGRGRVQKTEDRRQETEDRRDEAGGGRRQAGGEVQGSALERGRPARVVGSGFKVQAAGEAASPGAKDTEDPAARVIPKMRPDEAGPGAADDIDGHAGADAPALAWWNGGLQALDRRTGRPVWKQAYACQTPPHLLAADAGRLVLYDRYRVTALSLEDGRVQWTWGGGGPDPRGPNVDWESVPTILAAASTGGVGAVFTTDRNGTCLDLSTGAVLWQRMPHPPFVGVLAVSPDLAVYPGNQKDRLVYRVLDMRSGRDIALWKPTRDVPAEVVEILPAAAVLLVGTGTIEACDAYGGGVVWQVAARERFRPSLRLRRGTSFYIADGQRQLLKIDTLNGQVVWRAMTPSRAGASLRVLAAGPHIWLIDERGAHVIDDATGKTLQTTLLPTEIAEQATIREAEACDAGVLCLAVRKRKEIQNIPPVAVVCFSYADGASAGSIVGRLDEAAGPVSGWAVTENAVLVAVGNKVIPLRGRAKAGR